MSFADFHFYPPHPDDLGARLLAAETEAARFKADYEGACALVAKMHAAAVGEVTGPRIGPVEDVAAVRARAEAAEAKALRLGGRIIDLEEEVRQLRYAEARATDAERKQKHAEMDTEMYARAWARELGGVLVAKSHRIDSLVLTTRELKEKADRAALSPEPKAEQSKESTSAASVSVPTRTYERLQHGLEAQRGKVQRAHQAFHELFPFLLHGSEEDFEPAAYLRIVKDHYEGRPQTGGAIDMEPVAESVESIRERIADALKRSEPLVRDAIRLGRATTAYPGLVEASVPPLEPGPVRYVESLIKDLVLTATEAWNAAVDAAAKEVMDEDSWPGIDTSPAAQRADMKVIADNVRALARTSTNPQPTQHNQEK